MDRVWLTVFGIGCIVAVGLILRPGDSVVTVHERVAQPSLNMGAPDIKKDHTDSPRDIASEQNQVGGQTEEIQTIDGIPLFPPRTRSNWPNLSQADQTVKGQFGKSIAGRRVIFFDGDQMRRAHEIWDNGVQRVVDGETGDTLFQRDRRVFFSHSL